MRVWLLIALAGVAGAALTARIVLHHDEPVAKAPPPSPPPGPHFGTSVDHRSPSELQTAAAESNILPADYVGPAKCKECHEDRYAQWQQHPHGRMNQNASATTVLGDFNDARITVPQGDVTFGKDGDRYTMTLARGGKTLRRFVVTRTVGSRFMQFYIGKQLEGPEPERAPIYHVEQKLPYGYLFRMKRWIPQNYFDATGRELRPDGSYNYEPFERPLVHRWERSCLQCHNTYPYAYRLGLEAPRQGFALDAITPARKLRDTIAQTLDLSRVPPGQLDTSNALVADRDLVTLGISCEACHFGGRAHVKSEGDKTSWLPQSDLLQVKDEKKGDPALINSLCTQCHCAVQATFANGAGVSNSREALDMAAGACNPQIKCTDCHDPHISNGKAGQPASEKHLAACTRCHDKYKEPAAAAAHSHHGKDVTCLECHMPRIEQGLDQIVRSHRISSPADPRMLDPEQPNACNLCHLDKSIDWTVGQLATLWSKQLDVPSSAQPAGLVWLAAKSPFTRMAATQAWGRSPLGKTAARELIQSLEDTDAVNRLFASFAVEAVLGKQIVPELYDPAASKEERAKQIAHLLESVH